MPSPPSTPASSTPNSLSNPPAPLCLTPPSQSRRSARLARCAYIHARTGNRNGNGEAGAEGVEPAPERQGYNAEEVEMRRQERIREEREGWRGWEAEGEGYGGERFVGGLAGAGDGEGGLESLEEQGLRDAAPEQLGGGLGLPGLGGGGGAEGGVGAEYRAWMQGLDSPVVAGLGAGGGGRWQAPTLGAGAATGSLNSALLSGQTIPLVLGALYLLARAWGVGSGAGRRRRSGGDVQGKTREMGRRV
ncbi:hypothetical protein BCR35DRAFT_307242 [Leucosporidium creatinivorum]|uniref:Uncharacterized protein n=1 Tax=Leucosporidium creatinivorum TaxID=106004 RepID=A0A1Y2ENS1_9BASI|nr:hypothetical protein BCR35DRAFT_307242 [Leucosporidium creatinivorum]